MSPLPTLLVPEFITRAPSLEGLCPPLVTVACHPILSLGALTGSFLSLPGQTAGAGWAGPSRHGCHLPSRLPADLALLSASCLCWHFCLACSDTHLSFKALRKYHYLQAAFLGCHAS